MAGTEPTGLFAVLHTSSVLESRLEARLSEVGLSLALRGHARLALSAFADADLRATHYDVMLAEQRTPVIAPYRVRPGLMLGAQWR